MIFFILCCVFSYFYFFFEKLLCGRLEDKNYENQVLPLFNSATISSKTCRKNNDLLIALHE